MNPLNTRFNAARYRLWALAVTMALLLASVQPLPAVKQEITVAAVGDCIIGQKVSGLQDPALHQLAALLRQADCVYGNCETTFVDPRQAFPGWKNYLDPNLFCPPWGADELKWMGIDIVSLPNNHTMDWDFAGLFSTIANLERVGISYAGAGRDLEHAAKPGYFDSAGGIVSLVSGCSSIAEINAQASPSHPLLKGRPGLNPLNVVYRVQVDEETFAKLYDLRTELLAALGMSTAKGDIKEIDTLAYGSGKAFVKGEKIKIIKNAIAPKDTARICAAIKVAKNNSRIVIASNHEHGGNYVKKKPVDYEADFAHACIDAGADMFVNTGPHRPWGLEIYKGKPIFYSLGNFFFHMLRLIGPEAYTRSDFPADSKDPAAFETKFMNYFLDDDAWESVVPLVTFDSKNNLKEIVLYPIQLEKGTPVYQFGTPHLAEGKKAQTILEKFRQASAQYKTQVVIKKGVGRVVLAKK